MLHARDSTLTSDIRSGVHFTPFAPVGALQTSNTAQACKLRLYIIKIMQPWLWACTSGITHSRPAVATHSNARLIHPTYIESSYTLCRVNDRCKAWHTSNFYATSPSLWSCKLVPMILPPLTTKKWLMGWLEWIPCLASQNVFSNAVKCHLTKLTTKSGCCGPRSWRSAVVSWSGSHW